MIQFKGKPILQHNVELCKNYAIDILFINTHHLREQITSFFGDGSRFGVSISYSYEPELLGTSGALKNFESELSKDAFYIIYGDNYSNFDLSALKTKNEQHSALGTIAFHHREDTTESGVAEFNADLRIKRFVEKPKDGETESHWVNAGIYYLTPKILEYIPPGHSDFGQDIFPLLLKMKLPLYGVCKNVPVKAFDTREMYDRSMKSSE